MGFVAVCILSAPACYTLVQHPGIARRNYQRPPSGTPCTDCHAPAALRGYLEPVRIAREASPWDRLNDPWWLHARAGADSAIADSTASGGSP